MLIVRASCDADLPLITAIYRHHVLTGTGTFEIEAPSEPEMEARRADVLAKNLPYLVAELKGEVVGFAYCGWFKPRPAYRFSAEDSIYLSPGIARMGIGRILMAELCIAAERAGIRKLIAVIGDSDNAASIGLHSSSGFKHVGTIKDCGWKFDRWLDIVLMEKILGAGAQTKPGQSEA